MQPQSPRRTVLTPLACLARPGLALLLAGLAFACAAPGPEASTVANPTESAVVLAPTIDRAHDIVLVLHGGAGTLERDAMSAELEADYRATLTAALRAGAAALRVEGAPPDAGVVAAIRLLEDSPLFNAGRGAVLTHERRHELDASLMLGAGPRAGAVAGVTTVRHPIELARAVMERTEHVMLAGPAADAFAATLATFGLELVENSWFTTEGRVRSLDRALEDEAQSKAAEPSASQSPVYLGTVGCVARDTAGHLAAGTSTGGMTNKRHGRVGDSPIIGAGTWADDRTLGLSCTGHGEFFIRGAVAHDVHARMRYGGAGATQASRGTLAELSARGGEGGWVALTPAGEAVAAFNSAGMYRGWIDSQGRVTVRIWQD